MRNIKLSGFKRFLMLGLVFMVNTFFGTNMAYGVKIMGAVSSAMLSMCGSACSAIAGLPYGVSGQALLTNPAVFPSYMSFVPGACYCFDGTEMFYLTTFVNAFGACANFTGMTGTGRGKLMIQCSNVVAMSPIQCNTLNTAALYASGCTCATGYTYVNATSCKSSGGTTVACGYGQYKNGNTCYNCPAGKYANVINTATCVSCANGYYAAGTGNSTCTPCAKGTYGNGTAASSCTACPTLTAEIYAFSGGITSLVAFGGTTAGTGTTAITGCYIVPISAGSMLNASVVFNGFYESPGHYYDFTGNCPYSN